MKNRSIIILSLIVILAISCVSLLVYAGTSSNSPEVISFSSQADHKAEPGKTEDKPAEEKQSLEESLQKEVYVHPVIDLSAPCSKGSLYYRMLNTVDYFNTVSISFSFYFPNMGLNEVQVTIDSDLPFGKAYQSYLETGTDHFYEDISDGVSVVRFSHVTNRSYIEMPAQIREKNESASAPEMERSYIDHQGNPVYTYRPNITNADAASWCLFPQELTFACLSDMSAWNITEESEYLGRKSVIVEGTAPEFYQSKFGISTFGMCVDKATGIVLSFEGYDSEGTLVNYVHVSELIHDEDAEIRLKIEKAAEKLASLDFEWKEPGFELME